MSQPPYQAVIGVWDGHDAGAALVIDGRVVLALNEERLSGRKLDVGLPVRALAAELVRDAATAQSPADAQRMKALAAIFSTLAANPPGAVRR